MVFVKYNQTLHRRYNLKDEIDPISLNGIDDCNEWLIGEMDGDEEEGEDERVHEGGDDLTWRTVYQASGLDEPRQYTRRHKRKQVGSGEGQVGTSTNLSKRAKGVAAKNKGKRVGVVEEAEASEDSSSEEDELVPNADFIHSDGEEAEGFLNEQNHHVEINYADIDDEEED